MPRLHLEGEEVVAQLLGRYAKDPESDSNRVGTLVFGFSRLVAATIDRYRDAWQSAEAVKQADVPKPLLRYTGLVEKLETLLITMARCKLYLDALRRIEEAAMIPRSLGVLRAERIKEMRDAILHSDDRVRGGELHGLDPVLVAGRDGVRLAEIEVTYEELVAWIGDLVDAARALQLDL